MLEFRNKLEWEYGGFILVRNGETNSNEYDLIVICAFVSPLAYKFNKRAFDFFYAHLEDLVKDCASPPKHITFLSVRPGFKRKMERLGFQKRLVEYAKEI